MVFAVIFIVTVVVVVSTRCAMWKNLSGKLRTRGTHERAMRSAKRMNERAVAMVVGDVLVND